MTDFYVRNMNKSRGSGRFFFVVLLLTGLAGAAYWFFFMNPEKAPDGDVVDTPESAPIAQPARPSAPSAPTAPSAPQPVAAQPAAPIAPISSVVTSTLQQATNLYNDNQLLPARNLLVELMKGNHPKNATEQIKTLLGQINIELALSTRRMPNKKEYIVKSGDSFWKISRAVGNTIEYLQRANGVTPESLRPGDRLYYMTGKFTIEVDLSEFSLTLLHNGQFFKHYKVGVGREDRTPPGTYTVGTKIHHPPWDRRSKGLGVIPYGDPRNQLGECWMSLVPANPGLPRDLGIHGTDKPDTVGTNASAGCVRMRNHEVMELYAFILAGVPVTIQD